MLYQLSYRLGKSVPLLDPDAKAYVDAVVAAGATVTGTQSKAISDFVKTGKTDGWYSSIKRLYLPIWELASPNAIDLVSTNSGTFSGTVTHSAGYVQGNGSTGYFNTGVSASGLSLTNESAMLSVLIYQAGTGSGNQAFLGAYPSGTAACVFTSTNTAVRLICMDNATTGTNGTLARASQNGVLTATRISGTHSYRIRTSSGVSSILSYDTSAAGTPPTSNFFAMSYNSFGSPTQYSNAQFGAIVVGLGISDGDSDNYSSALKTMWETCTSLTIPA
jgi:hypothetical protein